VDELNKEIDNLNIDRRKYVDEIQKHTTEMEQLSPAMEASVSTYS
jgi:prefoldin subunit 5